MTEVDDEDFDALDERFGHQSKQERLRLRRQYRHAISSLEEQTENATQTQDLITKVTQLNQLFESVKTAQDASMDSKALMMIADISLKKTKALKQTASVFDLNEFLLKLETRLFEGLNVDSLGKRAPAPDFILGPLSIEHQEKQRKRIVRHEKNQDKIVEPLQMDETENQQTNETTQNVIMIGKCLRKAGKMNFFKFIINPESFSQSVENLFYLSFHIRDSRARLFVENEQLMVEPVADSEEQDQENKQLVIDFDMETWKKAVIKFQISSPTIPTREKVAQVSSTKWYG